MRFRRKIVHRRPLRRSNPPSEVGIPSRPAELPRVWRMRCLCGSILEIASSQDGKRQSCPSCRRRFDVRLAEDVPGGQRGLSLLYLTEGDRASGESTTMGSGTTSFQLPVAGAPDANEPPKEEPELPDEAHFKCPCGALLALPRGRYEKRSRCPACGARMIVFLLFDPGSGGFTVQLFSLIDPKSGQTQLLTRL